VLVGLGVTVAGIVWCMFVANLRRSEGVRNYYERWMTYQGYNSWLGKRFDLPRTVPEDVQRGIRASLTALFLFGLLLVAFGVAAIVSNL
jgi:hypothetical protein